MGVLEEQQGKPWDWGLGAEKEVQNEVEEAGRSCGFFQNIGRSLSDSV